MFPSGGFADIPCQRMMPEQEERQTMLARRAAHVLCDTRTVQVTRKTGVGIRF